MRSRIIQIGNSQGIRIPKVLLEETGISGDVEIGSSGDGILIRNVNVPRANWDAIFKSLNEGENDLSVDAAPTDFERQRWQW